MANIRETVNRIHSVTATQQITKATKIVAAVKVNKIQRQLRHLRDYQDKLINIIVKVVTDTEHQLALQYTQERPVQNVLLIVVSSDKGLCGSFNNNVLKQAINHLHQWKARLATVDIDILVIGKKALSFFKKHDYKVVTQYTDLARQLSYDLASQAATSIMNSFTKHTYDRVEIIYNHFVSIASQAVQIEQFLPSTIQRSPSQRKDFAYIYEPSKGALIEELVPKVLKIQFYKTLLESSASEYGSRMVTMGKATENAKELLKSLRTIYDKSRQAAITNEIAEISAGAAALASF